MAAVRNTDDSRFLEKIKENLNNYVSGSFLNGPDYIRQNKLLASLYMQRQDELNAIFHLTESHAATLRQRIIHTYYTNQSKNENHNAKFTGLIPNELHPEYIAFDNPFYHKGPAGVLERVQEMPREWTIVQLTFQVDMNEPLFGYFKTTVPEILKLHLTRLPCGSLTKERNPSTVVIQPPLGGHSDGLSSLLEVVSESIKKITSGVTKKQKFKLRQEASSDLKGIVSRDIISTWLKEWCCLMIGTLCDDSLQNLVKSTVDDILSSFSCEKLSKVTKRELSILYQIVDGCVHLSETEISRAVKYCVGDNSDVCSALVSGICKLKEEQFSTLTKAKRNPVLLILDDNLDFVPWEMLPVLFRHPVSRIPSLHFAHALYAKNKDDIVNGNKVIKNTDAAFYIINPERDLKATEETLIKFIQQRLPNWNGLIGEKPTGDLFIKSLSEYNIFMYSGHGNGVQYMNAEDVCRLNVDVIPFLFGCSSVMKKHIGSGGRNELMGVSDQFLIAGCPCVVGMLWPVTTSDTDLVTMMLLNMSMPGSSIDINEIIGSEEIHSDEVFRKEPELLRALKSARSAAKHYTNGAALIARGIPVEFQD